jgi:perosamine synthetase
MIALSEPHLAGREWEYVKDCLDTGWVSSVGSYVTCFENLLAAESGASHAVATSSGTAALHVALLVAGVEPGDEVLVSTLTFIAPANAVRYVGATPVFVDAEPDYWQMNTERVADFFQSGCRVENGRLINRSTGARVAAILPVHVLGHPVNMADLLTLGREYNIPVIEDATESLGSKYRGVPTGALGDIGCFSFNGNKIITTGGGGMIVTGRADWADRARYLTTQAKDDGLEFIHGAVGYNYRLTNLLAAVGCAQMEQLSSAVATRRDHARYYREALADITALVVAPEAPWATSNCWLTTVLLPAKCSFERRVEMIAQLGAVGVQARPLWQPMHLSPAHQPARCLGGEVAVEIQRRAISIPSSVSLTVQQRLHVVSALRYILQ